MSMPEQTNYSYAVEVRGDPFLPELGSVACLLEVDTSTGKWRSRLSLDGETVMTLKERHIYSSFDEFGDDEVSEAIFFQVQREHAQRNVFLDILPPPNSSSPTPSK